MWIVVLFENDNTLAAVPAFWFKNGSCAWPNKFSVKYIERRKQPNDLEFRQYKAKILFKNIDSYMEARKLAQDNSEVSSNDNIYEDLRKTKSKKSKILRSEQISSPPILESDESVNENEDDSDFDTIYKPFQVPNSLLSSKNVSPTLSFHEKTPTDSCNVPKSSSCKKIKLCSSSSSKYAVTETSETMSTSPQTQQVILTPEITIFQTSMTLPDSNNDQLQTFIKFTTRALTNMKYENENIQKRLDIITTLIEKTNEKIENSLLCSSNNTLNNVTADYDHDIICIDDVDDLNHVEVKLTDNRQYRAQLIVSLMRLMGNDVSETVRRIMQKMITDKFLAGYSFIGFKGKQQFSLLQSCAVIFESIHKMKKFTDIPTKDIEKAIKGWLAQAPSRIKKQSEKLGQSLA